MRGGPAIVEGDIKTGGGRRRGCGHAADRSAGSEAGERAQKAEAVVALEKSVTKGGGGLLANNMFPVFDEDQATIPATVAGKSTKKRVATAGVAVGS